MAPIRSCLMISRRLRPISAVMIRSRVTLCLIWLRSSPPRRPRRSGRAGEADASDRPEAIRHGLRLRFINPQIHRRSDPRETPSIEPGMARGRPELRSVGMLKRFPGSRSARRASSGASSASARRRTRRSSDPTMEL
jgi:hypothetical protein